MEHQFRKAIIADQPQIWEILQQAIKKRKEEGSNQWQDGYPNPNVIEKDIIDGYGYVLIANAVLVGYCSLIINNEPAYAAIEGKWLSESNFVVFHRIAIKEDHLGKGLAKIMLEEIASFALENKIYSIKADTNHDNFAMLKIFENSGYSYCGTVYFRGSPRMAFEKMLKPK